MLPEPLATELREAPGRRGPGVSRGGQYRGRRRATSSRDDHRGRRAPRGSRRHRVRRARTCSRACSRRRIPGDHVPRSSRVLCLRARLAAVEQRRAARRRDLPRARSRCTTSRRAWPLDDRPDRGAADRVAHGRLRGRPLERAARVARPARASGLAHPALQRRRAADDARAGRARRASTATCSASTPSRTPRTGRSTDSKKPQVKRRIASC